MFPVSNISSEYISVRKNVESMGEREAQIAKQQTEY